MQHLQNAVIVADAQRLAVAVADDRERKTLLLRLQTVKAFNLAQDFGKAERRRFERHLVRLDLRKIQKIVQHHHEKVAGIADDPQLFLLVRRQVAGFKRFGHAENAVHRRADLMAHIGEKSGFRLVRMLCSRLAFQRLIAAEAHGAARRFIGFERNDEMGHVHGFGKENGDGAESARCVAGDQRIKRQAEKIRGMQGDRRQKGALFMMHMHGDMQERARQPEHGEDLARNAPHEPQHGREKRIDRRRLQRRGA